jgi:flavin-dependent dehydrogenase
LTPPAPVDAAIIGGGPAGAAIGRLLASWGHAAVVLDRGADRARGLAESLPPSTARLLSHIGVLDAVERAGFYRTSGNTVWWGSRDRRIETFGASDLATQPSRDDEAFGYQVFRPAFDRVLLDSAAAAGARVECRAQVRRVAFDDQGVAVEYESRSARASGSPAAQSLRARFVIDCSGRAGVVARRFRVAQPEFRTYALVGVWRAESGWDLPDPTHTVVETFGDGWAWSVPVDATTRHIGAMVGHALPDEGRSQRLESTYRALIAKAPQTAALVDRAALQRVWACDGSLYSSSSYAASAALLAGDAGSFIDPLSSFGVKKALASAWLGAVAIHTALAHPERHDVALAFFSDFERRVYATHLERSRAFAREAYAEHATAFWAARAAAIGEAAAANADALDPEPAYGDVARDPDVQRALARFREAEHLDLAMSERVRFEPRPVVRGREIVLEPALEGGLRFLANVDLLKLAQIAPSCRHVPDVFEAYCRHCPPVPLPSLLGGLSLLVAKGILYERT